MKLTHFINCKFDWYYRLTLCLLVYFFTNSYYVSGQITYWNSIGAFITGSLLINIIYVLITMIAVYPLHLLYLFVASKIAVKKKRPKKDEYCVSCRYLSVTTFIVVLTYATYKFTIGEAVLWEAVVGGLLGAIVVNLMIRFIGCLTFWPLHSFFNFVWYKLFKRNVVQASTC
ncbi:MAG: hypothetical protein ACNFW9_01645 [Candidatus Kerfeldbacteria bacterium]